jgi:spermidine synthase
MLTILITAFLEGMSVLVVEIAGARALAPFFGTSLHVWTATITATLLFLALGYGLGGRLCRKGPMALPVVLWVAGGWLGLYPLWRTALVVSLQPLGISLGAFLASSWLFGPPLLCFGAVSPLLIKRLGEGGIEGGQAAGWLFLTNTLGGLVGGWLTALVLVPNFSLRLVLSGTGALVICIGALWAWKRGVHPVVFGLLIMSGLSTNFAPRPSQFIKAEGRAEMNVVHRKQTANGLVQVVDVGGVYRALLLDGATQGMIELSSGQSRVPFSDYLAAMSHLYHPKAERFLMLGLGCGILATTLTRMGKDVTAVEIEPEIYRAARRYFGLPEAVHVALEDARTFLAFDRNQYDVVVLDAYAGENSPWYLVTREGLMAVRERLAPGGRMVINVLTHADGTGEGLRRLEAGLLDVFGEARVFLEPRFETEGRQVVNGTLVAGKGLVPTTDPYPGKPAKFVEPFLGDMLASEHRPARPGAHIDTDDFSGLDVAEAEVRLGLRANVISDYGVELLQD